MKIKYSLILIAFAAMALFSLAAQGLTEEPGTNYFQADVLKEMFAEEVSFRLIDVRTPAEYESGHLPGAENLPLDTLPASLEEEDQDMLILLYCRSGNRSGQALSLLRSLGYANSVNLGGIINWKGPVVKGSLPGSY